MCKRRGGDCMGYISWSEFILLMTFLLMLVEFIWNLFRDNFNKKR